MERASIENAAVQQLSPPNEGLASLNEAELIAACAEGAPEAFQELLSRYRLSAVALAYQMLGNAEDAEDIAQEAFVRVFQAMPRFRRQAAFSTWLYRIVTNLCLGRMRRVKRDTRLENWVEPRTTASPSQQVTEGLLARQILAELSPPLRAVLLLRAEGGLSYREMAQTLDVPLGTVRSRLSSARAIFRRLWRERLDIGEEER